MPPLKFAAPGKGLVCPALEPALLKGFITRSQTTRYSMVSLGPGDNLEEVLDESLKLGVPLLDGHLHTLIVTLGPHGVLLITNLPSEIRFPTGQEATPKDKVRAVYYSAPKPEKIVSVSGAGDCFAAGMIGSILKGLDPEDCIRAGQRAALLSLSSHLSVPDSICLQAVFSKGNEVKSSVSVLL
ncbi:pfkB domain-containing protein [Trichonephila clavipes]|nr:pfkB domain-containing protein [Trichonephila clavipes]